MTSNRFIFAVLLNIVLIKTLQYGFWANGFFCYRFGLSYWLGFYLHLLIYNADLLKRMKAILSGLHCWGYWTGFSDDCLLSFVLRLDEALLIHSLGSSWSSCIYTSFSKYSTTFTSFRCYHLRTAWLNVYDNQVTVIIHLAISRAKRLQPTNPVNKVIDLRLRCSRWLCSEENSNSEYKRLTILWYPRCWSILHS